MSVIVPEQFAATLLRLKSPPLVSPQRKVGELNVRLTGGENEERHFLYSVKNQDRNWMIGSRRRCANPPV